MAELYFAQVREDARVERSLLEAEHPRQIVTVASGGCTALSLLDDTVERVLAVDVNPFQTALVELRVAAMRELERDAYLAFIGERPSDTREAQYRRLRAELSDGARELWDAHLDRVRDGIHYAGVTERFYRFVGEELRADLGDEPWRELLRTDHVRDQQALAQRHFQGPRWSSLLHRVLSKSAHLRFFPAFMFAQAADDEFSAFFAAQFQKELAERPFRANYFLSQLLFGHYAIGEHPQEIAQGVPPYLTEEGYARARRNLHKLQVMCAPLQQQLQEVSGIEAFYLSNVLDWTAPADREALGASVVRAAAPGARVLVRYMLAEPVLPHSLEQHLQVTAGEGVRLQRLERSLLYRAIRTGRIG